MEDEVRDNFLNVKTRKESVDEFCEPEDNVNKIILRQENIASILSERNKQLTEYGADTLNIDVLFLV
jgi:hypothetical protein